MEEFTDALTRLVYEHTNNPYIRFIVKRNMEQMKIKAYKSLSIELFLHVPGKNMRCITVKRTLNISNIDEKTIWSEVEREFYYTALNWIKSKEFKDITDEYKME